MFELDKLVNAGSCQLRKPGGVEFFAWNGEDYFTGVDQRGQHYYRPFRFEAQ
jgi:hypothetical protein